METQNVFNETQTMGASWIWITIIVGVLLVFGWLVLGLVRGNFKSRSFAVRLGALIAGVSIFPVLLILSILFLVVKLETQMSDQGIDARLAPFQSSNNHFDWSDIDSAYVRTYAPTSEYGGWGIKQGKNSDDKAISLWGDQGLQLVFHDGARMLIGTDDPEGISAALQKFGR